jgi:hypothetical protein
VVRVGARAVHEHQPTARLRVGEVRCVDAGFGAVLPASGRFDELRSGELLWPAIKG